MITIINSHDYQPLGEEHYQFKVILEYFGELSGVITTSPPFTTSEACGNYLEIMKRHLLTTNIEKFIKGRRIGGKNSPHLDKIESGLKYFLDIDIPVGQERKNLSLKQICEYVIRLHDTFLAASTDNEALQQTDVLIKFAKANIDNIFTKKMNQ